jgi:hypothetical protein
MTSRIYVQGDIASPLSLKIYDADTHVELTDVLFMDVTVSVTSATEATLHHRNKGSTVVDVVKDPSRKLAATPTVRCEFDLRIEEEKAYNGFGNDTMVEAILKRPGEQAYHVRRAVADVELANAADPAFVLEMHRRSAIQDVLTPLIDELAKKKPPTTTTSRMSNGGVVSKPSRPTTSLFPPSKDYDVLEHINKQSEARTHRQPCQECKGTGEVELFNGTVPCSTCAPDLGNNTSVAYAKETKFGATPLDMGWTGGLLHYGDEEIGKVINCRCTLEYPAENGKKVNDALRAIIEPTKKAAKSIGDLGMTIRNIQAGAAEQSLLEVIKRNSEKVHKAITGRTPVDTGFRNADDKFGGFPVFIDDIRPKGESIGDYVKEGDLKAAAARFMQNPCGEIPLGEFVRREDWPKHKKSECPDCKGTGKVTLFTSEEKCSTCCD